MDSKDYPFNPSYPCSLFVTQIPDSRFLPFLQYLRDLINTLRVDIIQNLIQNHTELLIRSIRAIRVQVFMYEIISVFPFILTIVFLHHDLAKLKPAWFCSRCSVVSVSSDVNIFRPQIAQIPDR